MQLKVVNWRGEVTASEAITDLAAASDPDGALLSAFYPAQTSLPVEERLAKAPPEAEYKWWPDGYEPIYYVLTQQACSFASPGDHGRYIPDSSVARGVTSLGDREPYIESIHALQGDVARS